jgi:hypothetical protein
MGQVQRQIFNLTVNVDILSIRYPQSNADYTNSDMISIIMMMVLIVVLPCMLTITKLFLQLNAHFYYLKLQIFQSVLNVLYFAPICFNPRGSSSGGSMPVPG